MADLEEVGQEEWVIEAVGDAWVRLGPRSDGEEGYSVPRSLLPDDVEAGDRFRIVALLERAGRREMPDAFADALEHLEGITREAGGAP